MRYSRSLSCPSWILCASEMPITGASGTIHRLTILLALISPFIASLAFAEEYSFDISETEKKPYSLKGYGEFRPVYISLDRTAAFYKLKFYDQGNLADTNELNFKLQPEASYEYGIAQLYGRGNFDFTRNYTGWAADSSLYEGYLSVKPSVSLDLLVGQKTLKWGKGYAWNPVAFADRPKNPDDPEIPREGYAIVMADYTLSLAGPLRTIGLSPVLIPVSGDLNKDLGSGNHLNAAGKLYLLLYDTDLDFMLLTEASGLAGYGMDFSRNLLPELEIHGETAVVPHHQKARIDQSGNVFQETTNALSYLLGARYQTKTDAVLIAEYYHNGKGYQAAEMEEFVGLAGLAYSTYLANGNNALIQRASRASANAYGAVNPMLDYICFRASQPEPFNILYLTPALTCVVNPGDGSYSIASEILYTRITNLELRLKAMTLLGDSKSEFGAKAGDLRVELRARYYF